MVEEVKEMGNLEGIGQFLKEKCVIVKNSSEEKSITKSLCLQCSGCDT